MSLVASGLIRVLVAAEDSLIRVGLATLISEFAGCMVVGQTADLDRLASEVELYQPDILVAEVADSPPRLTNLNDLTLPVIVIVPGQETASLAWHFGAKGILRRNVNKAQLEAALKAVSEGLTIIDAHFAGELASGSVAAPSAAITDLTERELQVLQLVAEGLTNKSIASNLKISDHTVKFHLNSILSKMGAQSRTQAVTIGTRLGLIKL